MMKKFLMFLALATALALPAAGIAAESFTITAVGDTDITDIGGGWAKSFKAIKAAWKGDGTDCTKANETIPAIKGKVMLVVTNPGATAPADNYDLTILDQEGVDIMGGALANRDTANTEQAMPKFGTDFFYMRPVYGPLTMTFTQTTNADCDGEVFIYYVE